MNNFGAFIIPTGVGAKIGGYAGDASYWARVFSSKSKLIVNPNVVNAGCFSGITDNMLYVEGFSLDEFFKNKLNLIPAVKKNKIGVIFDKSIPEGVLNVHINTINAVETVYDCDIVGFDITDEDVGVEFDIDISGVSSGKIKNISTLLKSGKRLLPKNIDALAVVCRFKDGDFDDYSKGVGVDPVGGVEAIISHYLSRELKIPCAHSPAFDDITITQNIVDKRCAAEYITPTYLPCVLIGLSKAPKLSFNDEGLNVNDLNFLIVPYDCLGSIPVFEALRRGIDIYAVRENETVLNVTSEKISSNITVVNSYQDLFERLF